MDGGARCGLQVSVAVCLSTRVSVREYARVYAAVDGSDISSAPLSHKAALKLLEKQRPVIKERLATFTREIYDDTPKEVP
mmetsp:Transcript_26118/g.63214  ORF Transcript_26118/g.63214 Transcript_26118/m.63214 type:complete len:80 (+) Transcript_26118:57-296(+)